MGHQPWEMHSLCHDDGDSIVENTLSKDQHVEGRIDVEGVEDGQGGHWVYRWDQSTEREATG